MVLPALALAMCQGCGSGRSIADASGRTAPNPTAAATLARATSANAAPTISDGADEYAQAGSSYEFQPVGHDADGDPLHFSADNLPPWASIDPATGRISGTPAADDVGVYESISIKVADAIHTVATPPFTITVLDPGSGNAIATSTASGHASLHWETPMSKVDGSPLDDLAGYRIVYGRSADDLDQSLYIDNPGATSYDMTALESGIWYFAVIAVNANGLEGPPSSPAMKSI